MNFKRNSTVYNKTTDNKTYKLVHYAHENMCCMGCVNRRRRVSYAIYDSEKVMNKFPNWKLVSKNRKQWMKKPLKYSRPKNWNYCTIISW